MSVQHFLSVTDLDLPAYQRLIERAIQLKAMYQDNHRHEPLRGKTLAMIFEQVSTRTRVAFEAGMAQLGGKALFLSRDDTALGRGETLQDTARVLSEMVHAVSIRTADQARIETFADAASVPVINAMSSMQHPCQILADMMTFQELRASRISGCRVAFVGDGHNMCQSYMMAAEIFDFDLHVACPKGFEPRPDIQSRYGKRVQISQDMHAAVQDADLVVTDVWSSLEHESEARERRHNFRGYQVDEALLDRASPQVLFMHCLPAHRGEEVSETLLDDPRSAVWQEAGNRLHSQKALLELLLGDEAR